MSRYHQSSPNTDPWWLSLIMAITDDSQSISEALYLHDIYFIQANLSIPPIPGKNRLYSEGSIKRFYWWFDQAKTTLYLRRLLLLISLKHRTEIIEETCLRDQYSWCGSIFSFPKLINWIYVIRHRAILINFVQTQDCF